MKTELIIALFIILGITIFCFFKRNTVVNGAKTAPAPNLYNNLRNMALEVPADKIGLPPSSDSETNVYGVVTDMDVDGGTATLVTFSTGDVSMYFSSGGAMIGGGQHESANKATKKFVLLSRDFLNNATKTDLTSLPEKGYANFYFLTNKGRYFAKDKLADLENQTSPLQSLFYSANEVITEIRLVSPKN